MQSVELPLFRIENSNLNYPQATQTPIVTEEQIITPLTEILNDAIPTTQPKIISEKLMGSLDDLFPEQQYAEKDIQKAKEILGELTKEFTPDQLKDAVTEIQYLCESWLDDLERQIFKGRTLNELLHEKGYR